MQLRYPLPELPLFFQPVGRHLSRTPAWPDSIVAAKRYHRQWCRRGVIMRQAAPDALRWRAVSADRQTAHVAA